MGPVMTLVRRKKNYVLEDSNGKILLIAHCLAVCRWYARFKKQETQKDDPSLTA